MRCCRRFLLVLAIPLIFGAIANCDDLPPADRPIPEVIDRSIDARLKLVNVVPAPVADDATFIRRVTLDLAGRIPTTAEVQAYLASQDPGKKDKLVDRLIASPGFVRHQANQFFDMLSAGNERRTGLRDYLAKAIEARKSWDVIFRELILPNENDPAQKGASDYLKTRVSDLDRVTNDVSVAFFGVNVSCAQCHDHPLVNDWKQDHFYGMKAFFARTFDNGGFLAEREFGLVRFKPNHGPERQAKMMFLTGATVDIAGTKEPTKEEEKKDRERFEQFKKDKKAPPEPKVSARAKFVETALGAKESEYFAKSLANRLWHRFLGYGLVSPLDQMHSENKPSHPELLDWLARDLKAGKYDYRRTIRGIVLSQAYARSSISASAGSPASTQFAVGRLKPLTPQQLATSMRIATTDPAAFDNLTGDALEKKLEGLENSAKGFASQIATPTDDMQIGVSEALLFTNNDRVLKEFIAEGGERLTTRLKGMETPAAIDLIVKTTLGRLPTAEEKAAFTEYLGRRDDRRPEAYRQVLWAILSGAEFRFNH
jgi:Protein of unknown function (DUF1549)/Protein of unknown function (DUF1553)